MQVLSTRWDYVSSSIDALTGNDRYTAVIHVVVDEVAPSIKVQQAAQAATVGGNVKVKMPSEGDTFSIPAGSMASGSPAAADSRAVLTKIDHVSTTPEDGRLKRHDFRVTWAVPTSDGDSVKPPEVAPNQRLLKVRLEWVSESKRRDWGFPLQDFEEIIPAVEPRKAGDWGGVCNAAGWVPHDLPSRVRFRPVVAFSIPVQSPFDSIPLHNAWRNTWNDSLWQGIPAREACYLSARTSEERYYRGTPYYELTVRVEIFDEPDYIRIPNAGPYYLDATAIGQGTDGRVVATGDNGYQLDSGHVLLSLTGERANQQNAHGAHVTQLLYSDRIEKNYNLLATEIQQLRIA